MDPASSVLTSRSSSSTSVDKDVRLEPGGKGNPVPGRYVVSFVALALDVSIARGIDLDDEV